MNNILKTSSLLLSGVLLQGCIITEPISHHDMKATENSTFTADGRFFVIGKNTADESWVFEVVKDAQGNYSQIEYLKATQEGTIDGTLSGATEGEDCVMGGLTSKHNTLYAVCGNFLSSAAITVFEVSTEVGQERVRTGHMTADNFEPLETGDSYLGFTFFANGMEFDDAGHLYLSNSSSILSTNATVIAQLSFDASPNATSDPTELSFTHQPWLKNGDSGSDFFPNGIQIEDDILYYATKNEIRKVRMNADYSAGEWTTHYRGLMTDDFDLHDGYIALATVSFPGAMLLLPPGDFDERVKPIYSVPLATIPSSVSYQHNNPSGDTLFEKGSFIVTSFFGGGIYQID